MRALIFFVLALLLPTPATAAAPADVLQLSSGPSRIYIETLPDRQDLNFELFLRNNGTTPLSLRRC